MKFDLPIPTDGKVHIYCVTCDADNTKKTQQAGRTVFVCPRGHKNDRALYYGGVKFWIAPDKELWHESVGVFVRNAEGKFLFTDRTEFPFGIAVPAGHVDEGESPLEGAKRELEEEAGLPGAGLRHLFTADITGHGCSGGSDAHRWYVYGLELTPQMSLRISDEGQNPVWLSLTEAATKEAPYEIRYMLKNFSHKIDAADWPPVVS
jgi:8-oxo-dGTP pyrophosphatase MutT (NUDIX family)